MASSAKPQASHADYLAIHSFLDDMLTPPAFAQNCSAAAGHEYVWSDMGCGGGFAAHFQLAAALWMRAAALTQYRMPVLIAGHIWKYSEGPECAHVKGDWTCFFLPMSGCEQELRQSGKQVQVDFNRLTRFDDSLLPEQFRHVGIAYWWGIVQERMFRMQPEVQTYVLAQAARMGQGQGHAAMGAFPGLSAAQLAPNWLRTATAAERLSAFPALAGLHVRHGDKHSDGFRLHSMEMQLRALRATSQCEARMRGAEKADSQCWTHPPTAAAAAAAGSSSPAAVPVPGQSEEQGPSKGSAPQYLPVFVASDDAAVLSSAAQSGFLVADRGGVSQATHTAGMVNTLLHKPELGYNASLEIIRDIYLLSRCTTLVGIAASQVFRIAVDLSTARGTLVSATAMDHAQLPRVAQMSAKYHLPLVETFALPPAEARRGRRRAAGEEEEGEGR